MEDEELKKLILKVLNSVKQNGSNKKLLVFSGDDRYLIEKFFLEARRISRKHSIKIAVDRCSQKLLSESRVRQLQSVNIYGYSEDIDLEEIFAGVDAVIMGSLDIGAASKISNFMMDSLSSKIAYHALINNTCFFANDFLKDISAENKNYHLAINKVADTLKSYGVQFSQTDEIIKQLNEETACRAPEMEAGNMITEEVIKKFRGTDLKVRMDAVITPLAKDMIRERKIHVLRGQ